MSEPVSVLEILEASAKRRTARREFIRLAGGATAMVGGLSLLAACGNDDDGDVPVVVTPTPSPTASPIGDADILNFALNLEYLEAQFYSYAAFGSGLDASMLSGSVGTAGAVANTGTAFGPRAVTFSDTVLQEYAREIAYDERAHVTFLRTALGSAAIAQPAINIDGGTATAPGAFTAAARAAQVVASNAVFDPYASENNFLLAAFIFEDVGVTAYKGASPLISNTYIEAAAGLLAVEAYHAGLVRTILYARGVTTADLYTNVGKISDARDTLDGTPADDPIRGIGSDDDQGIAPTGSGTTLASNIVPTNSNGLAYSRTPQQIHNIVYLNATGANRTSGGFFPAGTNNGNASLRVGL